MANQAKAAVLATLTPAIAAATSRAIKESATGLDAGDAAVIARDVTKEATAVVLNQTNSEPWTQSTVTAGALLTIAASVYGLIYNAAVLGQIPTPAEFPAQIGPLIGAGIVIYGRWFRAKPLGH